MIIIVMDDYTPVSMLISNLDLTSNNRNCVNITIITDNDNESNETFSVQLSSNAPSVTLSPSNAIVTILNTIGMCDCTIVVQNRLSLVKHHL